MTFQRSRADLIKTLLMSFSTNCAEPEIAWLGIDRVYGGRIPFPVQICCETWSLTLREEHRLKAFENRVLRRIFGPKRDEVTVGLSKLRNEELITFTLLQV
jgi:hypothetical protein